MLIAIYKTGSSLILENYNDIDYIYYFDNNKDRIEALARNHKNGKNDNHFRLISSEPKIILGCYIYPYMELVKGEEILALKDFNLRDHKKEYVELLKKYVPVMQNGDKRWYHILIAYYIFKEDSWQEHLDEIQTVHDEGISPELKTTILKYFKIEEE